MFAVDGPAVMRLFRRDGEGIRSMYMWWGVWSWRSVGRSWEGREGDRAARRERCCCCCICGGDSRIGRKRECRYVRAWGMLWATRMQRDGVAEGGGEGNGGRDDSGLFMFMLRSGVGNWSLLLLLLLTTGPMDTDDGGQGDVDWELQRRWRESFSCLSSSISRRRRRSSSV